MAPPQTQGPKTRVVLVGAGSIAETHLAALRTIAAVEVVAICDPVPGKAERLAERWQVGRWGTSLAEVLGADGADAAHVVVPPPEHASAATACLEAGLHVFVEKPAADGSAAARELAALARGRGLELAVNHNAVFHPLFLRIAADLASLRIGRVEHVVSVTNLPLRQLAAGDFGHWMFQEPVNIVLEQGLHPLSMVHRLLGPARRVEALAAGERSLAPDLVFFPTWLGSLQCERGTAQVALRAGASSAESWLHVIGQDGSLHADLLHGLYRVREKTRWLEFHDSFLAGAREGLSVLGGAFSRLAAFGAATLRLAPRNDLFYLGMKGSIEAFHETVRGARAGPPPASGDEGAAVVELCERIGAAARPPEGVRAEGVPGRSGVGAEGVPGRSGVRAEGVPGRSGVRAEGVPGGSGLPIEGIPRKRGARKESGVPASTATRSPARDREVLVVGATGFIGRNLVERLRQDRRNVSVVTRRLTALPAPLRDPEVRLFAGDITDLASLRTAMAGCTSVVHLATGAGSTVEELRRTMVAGTVNVAEACLAAGVERLVFTSTIAVYFMGRRGERITEATPRDPRPELRGAYARAKIECEEALERLARERELPLVVLRPAVVVGGDAPFQHSGLGYWASDTWCVGWGMGRTPVPFVLVEDVAGAIVRALDAPGIEGRSFNLAGDVRLSARELARAVARAHGRPVHFHPRPLWLAQAMELGKWCVKVAGRRPAPWPSYRDLATRSLVADLDCSAAKEALGWRPVADPAEFLARAARAPT